MNRHQKILSIKLGYIGLFFLTLIFLFIFHFPIETIAIILYPIITVLVLIWRSVRDDYDLFLRKKLVFDVNDNLNDVSFLGKFKYRDKFHRILFYKFKQNTAGKLKIHFDIANQGNSEITLHDYNVNLLYPKKEILTSVPLFETVRIYNPIENRITEETNYLQRKKLEKGGLHTRIFPLHVIYDYMLISININTYQTEVSHSYLFFFNGDVFFYTRFKSGFLLNRKGEYFIKNRKKIENFLKQL